MHPEQLVTILSPFLLLLLAPSTSSQSLTRPQPQKRTYDTHTYYVLELQHPPSDASSPSDRGSVAEYVARSLGAESVEQVGELRDHWVIRADNEFVKRGFHGDEEIGSVGNGKLQLERRIGGALGGQGQGQGGAVEVKERDAVMERFELMKRGTGPASSILSKRSSSISSLPVVQHPRSPHPVAIRSLERQVVRKRAKRDAPYHPPGFNLDFELRKRQQLPPQPPPQQLQQQQVDPNYPTSGAQVVPAPLTQSQKVARDLYIRDPIFSTQWHLVNDKSPENSINVTGVWGQGNRGQGIKVCIVDDGLDMHSDDLADNFFPEGSWDFNDHLPLPEPRLIDDQHGTRCAGEIAAVNNTVCGLGVAPSAKVSGVRILSAAISDIDEAAALNFAYQENDIYSCSWGPPDDGQSMEAPSRLITKSIINGIQNGRGGKGSVFVFASGNGGAADDQCNFDGYTNSIYSITVSAIDWKGLHPYYSEACSANMVVTYSSGSGENIHTTDVGKNSCTDRHGGTSAAAPIAAGIFALVLQARRVILAYRSPGICDSTDGVPALSRPELTWRDMQHLCVKTAIQVNPGDPDWQVTHAGRPYNHKYGFGKLDAYRIVEAAKTHQLVKPQAYWESPVVNVTLPITGDGAKSTIVITRDDVLKANLERLEHVTVVVDIDHQRRGNVEIELVSPAGVKSVLARTRRMDEADTGFPSWKFMSLKHWEEDPIGPWVITVKDQMNNGKNGTFIDWSMSLWGESINPALAVPYTMPDDDQIVLPPPPQLSPSTSEEVPASTGVDVPPSASDLVPTPTPTMPQVVPTISKTKSIARPTEHLPEDHADAPGESHLPFGGDPTTPGSPSTASGVTPSTTPRPEENINDPSAPGYLSGVTGLMKNQTWVFIGLGMAIIFAGAISAFFIIRTLKRRSSRGRGGYDFQPVPDEEDMPMSAMEGGKVRLGGGGGGARGDGSGAASSRPSSGGGRTKDLYDAFGVGSDSDGENEEAHGLVEGQEGGGFNTSYMRSYHDLDEADAERSGEGHPAESSRRQAGEVLFDSEDHASRG